MILLSGSRTRASRLAGDLREYDLRAFCPDQETQQVQPGEILVTYGNLHRGFEYPQIKFLVITEGDMFGTEKKKRKRKKTSYEGKKIQSFSELSAICLLSLHQTGAVCGSAREPETTDSGAFHPGRISQYRSCAGFQKEVGNGQEP